MADAELPTTNDFLARIGDIDVVAAAHAKQETQALVTRHAARGLLRSGATLKALAAIIENEFKAALVATLDVLRHMRAVPGTDYDACRDQAVTRTCDLLQTLRGATDLDKWLDMIGRGSAADVIDARIDALKSKIDYRFRQFDVGLDQAAPLKVPR